MSRKLVLISAMIIVVTATIPSLTAQTGRQYGPTVPGDSAAPGSLMELQGVVETITMGFGQGMPSFTMAVPGRGTVTVLVGPYRAWNGRSFELKSGMTVEVRALPSVAQANTYRAVEIRDPATNATIQLMSQGGGPGRMRGWAGGERPCAGTGPQLDLANRRSFTGTVVDVEVVRGQGLPNFTLDAGGAGKVTIIASPYRVLAEADFAIRSGDKVAVDAYPSLLHEGAYVAAKIDNETTGKSVILRNENGYPVFGMGFGARNRFGGCWRMN